MQPVTVWRSFQVLLSMWLTIYTEILFLEAFKNGVGFIVATCFLSWTIVVWIVFFKIKLGSILD